MALSVCGTVTDLHDQELKEHGDSSFPIACYNDDLANGNVPWHWHEEWEFIIVYKGCAELLLENQKFPIQEGDGILINGKALHAVENHPDQSAVLHSAVFHPRLIGGNADSIYWQQLVQPFVANPTTRFLLLDSKVDWAKIAIDSFLRAWDAVAKEGDDFENITRFELSSAVRQIILHNDLSSNMSEQELLNASRIRTMLEYIEEHYKEEISVDSLASTISVSESACLRCFHQMLHTTPMQYVKQLRIKKSADLLRNTNKSAKEIAFECGFNDMSYFTRAFKESYGKTPGEFRKD